MPIGSYPEDLDYVNAKMMSRPGGFLNAFFMACVNADAENYEIMRPALHLLMDKYPADPGHLTAVRLERGLSG